MTAIETLISLAMALGLIVLYNSHRVDRLRDDLFAIRDALFDEARAGRISFNGPGYTSVRAMCNGLIRFAHKISLLEFMAFSLLAPKVARGALDSMEDLTNSLPEHEREIATKYRLEANACVIRHLARSPFLLLTVIPPLTMCVMTKAGIDMMSFALRCFSKQLRSLDSLALGEGRRGPSNAEGDAAPTMS